MYCSTCGVAVSQRLSFCNHCGARIVREDSVARSGEVRPESLIFGMLATFVFGLLATSVLIGVMKAVLDMQVGQIFPFAILSFVMIMLMEGVFIGLLLKQRRSSDARERSLPEPSREQVTNELDAAQPRVLAEPVPSVTEHTTRAFDPILTERK
ncbi:MAG TPA: hypothetical protein VGW58_09120 [Pyrinomonadaceae bacterium]|nr:hypothetical protein [Pyrinomonadaceae bacterium]